MEYLFTNSCCVVEPSRNSSVGSFASWFDCSRIVNSKGNELYATWIATSIMNNWINTFLCCPCAILCTVFKAIDVLVIVRNSIKICKYIFLTFILISDLQCHDTLWSMSAHHKLIIWFHSTSLKLLLHIWLQIQQRMNKIIL